MQVLDNYLLETIIQEMDIKSISKNLMSKDPKRIEKVSKKLPKVKNIDTIKKTASKKIPGFDKVYKEEERKFSGLSNSNKKLATSIIAPLVAMNRLVSDKKTSHLDNLVTKLRYILMKLGSKSLSVGMIILIISLLGKYFWEATVRYPEIRAIFNFGKKYQPLATVLVVVGTIMMIISYLIELLQEKIKEDKKLKNQSGNSPYDEEY